MSTHHKVDVSFYVPINPGAETAKEAEELVEREINSRSIQHYISDTIGDADVHYGDTIAWDMEG